MLEAPLALIWQEAERAQSSLDHLGPWHGLVLLLLGGMLLRYGWPRWGALSELGRNDVERPLGSWGAREVFELCAAALALLIFIGWQFGEWIEAGGGAALLLNALWMLVTCGIAGGLAWQSDRAQGLRALGIQLGRLMDPGDTLLVLAKRILLGLSSYALMLPLLLGIYLVWPTLATWFGVEVHDQEVLTDILRSSGASLVMGILVAGALGPLLEEWLFRGFLQPVLVRSLGALGGIAATSLLFALVHGAVVFLPIFCFSMLLGWVQLRTRCLWASWAVHALHNSLVLSLYLLAD